MAYCTKCGAPIGEGDLFCSKCGTRRRAAGSASGPRTAVVRAEEDNAALVREYLRGASELEYTRYQIQQIGQRLNADLEKGRRRITEIGFRLDSNHSRAEAARAKQTETVSTAFTPSKYKAQHSLSLGEYFVFLLILVVILFAGAMGVSGFSSVMRFYEGLSFARAHPFLCGVLFGLGVPLVCSLLFNLFLDAIGRSRHMAGEAERERALRARDKEQQARQRQQASTELAGLKADTERLEKERQGLQQAYIPQLNEEIAKNRRALADIEADLRKYYAPGVLDSAYQGLIPVTTMYQYFKTGRCSRLTGHEGAYNLYESELRLNTIVGKVDQLSKRVDRLAQGQQELLRRVSSIGSSVTDLMGSVEAMGEQNRLNMEGISRGVARLNTSAELQTYYTRSIDTAAHHIDTMLSNEYYSRKLY